MVIRLILILFLPLLFLACTQDNDEPNPPNILLILSDDQGWGDVGYNGNQLLETPNLDHLAATGVVFNRFYVNPVCAPSRAAILTGKYAFRTGVVGVSGGYENLDSEEITMGDIFQQAGYRTGIFGKWHNGRAHSQKPNQQGFDEFLGFCSGGIGNYFDPNLEWNGKEAQTKGYIADILTDSAMHFITGAYQMGTPFFCYLPYNTPHTPIQITDSLFDKYKDKGLNAATAGIYGMIDNLDWNVGRLISHLDQLGIRGNTLVVFLSDNGPIKGRYNGELKGYKGSLHEGGVRVPCVMNLPGRLEPAKIERLAAHVDLLPTFLQFADIDYTIESDGCSLWPLIKGKPWPNRQLVTMKQTSRQKQQSGSTVEFSIRTDSTLVVESADGDAGYDLVQDPGQQQPLSLDLLPVGLVESKDSLHAILDVTDFRPQPLPMGEPGANQQVFYADEGHATGHVEYYKGFGYNSDWFTYWSTEIDSIYWHVNNKSPATYHASLLLNCNQEAVGSSITLKVPGQQASAEITESFLGPIYQTQDRVISKGWSSLRKPWKEYSIGDFNIKPGIHSISFHLESIRNSEAMFEVRGLKLMKID